MGAMQRLEGLARKAMQSYHMVAAEDVICVAVSGGKDSVALATALNHLRSYYELPFSIHALTVDPCFEGQQTDYSALADFFAGQGIPYTIQRSGIGKVVFETRQEQNPCALCAKLRRGALHSGAQALGCNKIALGHHLDDAIETFLMNLLDGGTIACFSPVTWLSRRGLTMIRPFVFAEEREVARAVRENALPVVKNPCPVDGATHRAEMKSFVARQKKRDPAFLAKMLGALQKADVDGWAPTGLQSHRGGG